MENSINQNDRHNNKNLISINRLIGLIKWQKCSDYFLKILMHVVYNKCL
jgi:hypothetical protein